MIYTLWYQDICLGKISESGQDFPNLFGSLERFQFEDRILNLFLDYLNKQYPREDEAKLVELIESNDWYLIKENTTEKLEILPPFVNGEQITWRWNFSDSGEAS